MKYCLTIDTEEEWDWAAGFPVQSTGVNNILRMDRFAEICQRHGAKTTYLVNHAVLDQKRSCDVIKRLNQSEQVEIGMHVHPWTTPPYHSADNTTRASFLENLTVDLALQKLNSTYQLHRERGFHPRSFRGGRYSSGKVTQQFLSENGFRVDASICPFTEWSDDGAPSYRNRSVEPTLITEGQHGVSPMWSVPLTRIYSRKPFRFWNQVHQQIADTQLSRLRLIGLMERLNLVRKIWLNFEVEKTQAMLWIVRNAHRLGLSNLCFTVHSSSLSVGPSPYARTDDQVDRILDGVDQVLKCLASDSRYQSATLSELAESLDAGLPKRAKSQINCRLDQ